MNWDAIGAVGEIIGALAVVFSIAYLAIQIRQNAKSLQSTVEQSISNQFSSTTANASMSNIPGLIIRASKDPSGTRETRFGPKCPRAGEPAMGIHNHRGAESGVGGAHSSAEAG